MVMYRESFALHDYLISTFTNGIVHNGADLCQARDLNIKQALENKSDENVKYRPFDISELSTGTMMNLNALVTNQIRGLVRPELAEKRKLGLAESLRNSQPSK